MKSQMFTILLAFLLATVLADHHVLLSRGGTTCIPDEAESCTAVEGSSHVMVVGGVNVDTDNTCAAGTADTYGVHVAFTATAGFYTIASQGVGEFRSSGSYAVLVFQGDATLDSPCDAYLTFRSAWTGWLDAGDYNIVVTSNNGAADACGEFGVTVHENEYELTGTVDTWIQTGTFVDPSCFAGTNNHVALIPYTPAADGTFLFAGVGRINDTDSGPVAPFFIAPTADLPTNFSSADSYCEASVNFVTYDVTAQGYVLTGEVEYTLAFQDFDTPGGVMIFANAFEVAEIVYPDCDELLNDQQNDWLRPDVPATSITTECVEGTTEYKFDVRHFTFDFDAFVVVDTVSCTNPDDDRSNVDGAVVLYYGAQGTPAEGDDPAVAPEPCDNFIIAGDSGDGGAVFYWFPADEDLTVVPTTYSTTTSEIYTLTVASYEIAGCVPANPYLVVDEPATDGVSVVALLSVLMAIVLL
jgi:hypothetical protein